MTLGWRGVMTKYSGFYDLPTAWNQVFWGILLGGAFASYADSSLFLPYYEAQVTGTRSAELNVIRLLLVPLIATIGMHFLLRRKRVRKGGSQATKVGRSVLPLEDAGHRFDYEKSPNRYRWIPGCPYYFAHRVFRTTS